jgi:hypothetical protein
MLCVLFLIVQSASATPDLRSFSFSVDSGSDPNMESFSLRWASQGDEGFAILGESSSVLHVTSIAAGDYTDYSEGYYGPTSCSCMNRTHADAYPEGTDPWIGILTGNPPPKFSKISSDPTVWGWKKKVSTKEQRG